jgi:hypothetical protein
VAGVVEESGIRCEKACWASDFRNRVPLDATLTEESAIAEQRERLRQRVDAHESGIKMAQIQLEQLDNHERAELAKREAGTSS